MFSMEWGGGGGKSGGHVEGQVESTLTGVDSEPCGSQGLKLMFCLKMVLVNRIAWSQSVTAVKPSPLCLIQNLLFYSATAVFGAFQLVSFSD